MTESVAMTVDDAQRIALAANGGIPYRPDSDRDPFEAWIALMEVVEALCPRWPARDHRTIGTFKL